MKKQIPDNGRAPQSENGFTDQQHVADTDHPAESDKNDGAGQPSVLFADIVGSTTLYEALGDAAAKRLIDEALTALSTITKQHGGRVIKTIGDEIMCLFPSAEKGFHAANGMQKKIDSLPNISGTKRRIRVGFHAGPVIVERGDVFGDTVNIAARMVGLAKGMQIMTTRGTVDALPPHLRLLTRNIADVAIKGRSDGMMVCEVLWQQEGNLTMMVSAGPVNPQASGGELRLRHGSRELVLHSKRPNATIGRDLICNIVILDIKASRSHARIEKRRDKFFLSDHSTNGTFVRFQGESEITLRREEIMLRGTGRIMFGRSDTEGEGESLEFQVDP